MGTGSGGEGRVCGDRDRGRRDALRGDLDWGRGEALLGSLVAGERGGSAGGLGERGCSGGDRERGVALVGTGGEGVALFGDRGRVRGSRSVDRLQMMPRADKRLLCLDVPLTNQIRTLL